MSTDRLALFTVVYPGVERFLAGWYRSVVSQTDDDFDLWISLDGLSIDECRAAMGARRSKINFLAASGKTPARIRHAAVGLLVEQYSSVVFVDSDDLLLSKRVESARRALERYDLTGCALRIMDEDERDLSVTFQPPDGDGFDTLLPRYNVFGLSNTAYRGDLLRRCLPIPDDCQCIDWLLATRAWALDAEMHFDPVPGMAYRQYDANVARVLPPFSGAGITRATERVLNHYRCVLNGIGPFRKGRRSLIEDACRRAESFYRAIMNSAEVLDRYAEALNKIKPQYIWWWCVAHPDLESIWKN